MRSIISFSIALLSFSILYSGMACPHGEDAHDLPPFDPADTIAANHAARHPLEASYRKIALNNVRVFDGKHFLPPRTVVIDGAFIGSDANGAEHADGKDQFLLPGLIDTHCHPTSIDDLRQLTSFGVTTGLVQTLPETQIRASLLNHTGLSDLRFATYPAAAPKSPHAMMPGFQNIGLISSPEQVPHYMATVVETGTDWVKLLTENPGLPTLSQASLNALVKAAHGYGKFTVCHSTAYESANMALEAGVDQIHHAPLDKPYDNTTVHKFLARGISFCPTLAMMQAVVDRSPTKGYSFAVAAASVRALYEAGVPILGGTDSFSGPVVPGRVPFGEGLHLELELLVQAGLAEVDALRSVTSLPAGYYGLRDRGYIAKGMRADLVLLGSNPLKNISATRDIKKIFTAGVEHVANTTAPALTVEGLKKINPPSEMGTRR